MGKETVKAMEGNRLLKKYCGDDRVCYLGNVGTFREGADEYGMGGAACTYWNIDRKDDTAVVWFTQHVDMPEYADLKGVDPDKADLWKLLHNAKTKKKMTMKVSGVKRTIQKSRTAKSSSSLRRAKK